MREFKFRAWDDEAHEMYSPEALEQSEVLDDTKKSIYSYLSFGILCIYDFRAEEPIELVPMQFTGWYDKNQMEIYEGDLIKFENVIHQIMWSDEISGFIILSNDGTVMMGGDYLGDTAEIVGNIYENPEYLNFK
ncbi:YopX family protein [Clostridiaceae bacterium 35-E11]